MFVATAHMDVINEAMNEWMAATCLIFRPKTAADQYYITYQDSTG